MRLTKFGHACIRIEHDDATVVVDPGVFTEPDALDGATAILITHEHADHFFPDLLKRSDAPIFTIDGVTQAARDQAPEVAERITVVRPGEDFDAGVPVRAVGELHAVIHPDLPRVHNSGYLISAGDQKIFHPGDALTRPTNDRTSCAVSCRRRGRRPARRSTSRDWSVLLATSRSTTGSIPTQASASSTATSSDCSARISRTSGSPTARTCLTEAQLNA